MYLTKGLGYSIVQAGWISSAFQFGGVFGSPIVGYLVDNSTRKYEQIQNINFHKTYVILDLLNLGSQT